jgi:hypothetical protein
MVCFSVVRHHRYADRLAIRFGFYLCETDMLKSGVKPSIRRTGAEIIDFLVLAVKLWWRKTEFEMN